MVDFNRAEMRYATFHVESVKADAGGRKRVCMSSPSVDRVGDSIAKSAWKLDNFLANSVMLYEHRSDEPVGVWTDVGFDGEKLVGSPLFHPKEINPFADRLRMLYEGGWLKGVSVGFRALKLEPMPTGSGYLITEAELLECSLVTIPANTDALFKAVDPSKVRPVFSASHPFATAEARKAGRDEAAVKAFRAGVPLANALHESSQDGKTWSAEKAMTEEDVRRILKTMLDEMKQPGAQTADNASDDGAAPVEEDEDLVAVELAELEAETAEINALAAEIELEA